ncbi:unnamed protein product [Calypogeia fissa]
MNGSTQQKMTNAKQKWKVVAQFMQEEGSSNLVRDAASCKKKWQMIDEKFKKIHDWEKKEKSGQVSYFNMDDKEWKEKRLSTNFFFDLFTDLLSWPSRRGVKRKENSKAKSGKEKQANLIAIADSCAQMVAATKLDIEIRERQENALVTSISGANASTMEQLARLNETLLQKLASSSSSSK